MKQRLNELAKFHNISFLYRKKRWIVSFINKPHSYYSSSFFCLFTCRCICIPCLLFFVFSPPLKSIILQRKLYTMYKWPNKKVFFSCLTYWLQIWTHVRNFHQISCRASHFVNTCDLLKYVSPCLKRLVSTGWLL